MTPRRMLGLDALGALFSAWVVFAVLVPLEGVAARPALLPLGVVALGLCVVSASAWRWASAPPVVLRRVAVLNGLYALLTLSWLVFTTANPSGWTRAWLSAEAVVLVLLAGFELRVARAP